MWARVGQGGSSVIVFPAIRSELLMNDFDDFDRLWYVNSLFGLVYFSRKNVKLIDQWKPKINCDKESMVA